MGGQNPDTGGSTVIANTEFYNGTAWSEVGDLGTANKFQAGAGGTASSGISIAGSPGPGDGTATANTEEWTKADFLSKTVTTS